ncbi:MAG: SLATT domain-containing protein, partial [Sphingobacteriaceae bacterium]
MNNNKPPKPQVVYEPLREWDPVKASEKLIEMYNEVIQTAGETIIWYHERRKTKGWWARALRLASITLLVGSTIIPYLAAFNSNDGKILYIGYIMAGLGGGFLLFDQYYGLSNSWIRFVVTGMDLHNARTAFIKNWQVMCFESYPLTKKSFGVMVDSLLNFQDMFNGIVRAETAQWAKEFQQNFKELIEAMNKQRDKLANDIEENRQARKKIEDEKTGNANQADTDEKPAVKVPDWVIDEAVNTKGEEWKKQYAAQAIFAGKKTVEDGHTNIYAVVIQPQQKIEAPDKSIAVPPIIEYDASDGEKYGLPTDIQPTGGKIYASGACDGEDVKQPGCSVSR